MTKLQQAIARISTLPEATQDSIAEKLLLHVRSVEHLRAELQKGIDSIERGDYGELDIDEVIERARSTYDGQ